MNGSMQALVREAGREVRNERARVGSVALAGQNIFISVES